MYLLKKILMVLGLVLFFATNLYADEKYTINTTSLHKAIKKISEISKLPFIVDTSILKDITPKPIRNEVGLQNVLNLLLEETDLEAIISNEIIVIRKRRKLTSKIELNKILNRTMQLTSLTRSLPKYIKFV